jgi:hypothetical protein
VNRRRDAAPDEEPEQTAAVPAAALAGAIGVLADVDEFLRTPGTWDLLEAFYRDRRGRTHPGCDASQLIDEAGFALHSLLRSAAAMSAGSLDAPVPGRPGRAGQEPQPTRPSRTSFPRRPFSFHFSSDQK